MSKQLTGIIKALSILVAGYAFLWLTAIRHGGTFRDLWGEFVREPDKLPQFITPCLVFVLSISAYFKFIVEYKRMVAGWSFLGALLALVLCLRLVEAKDWWDHLRLLYMLFFTYVVWDILMMDVFLRWELEGRESSGCSDTASHIEEVNVVSSLINQPTLVTAWVIWGFALCLHYHSPEKTGMLDNFVTGVVSFHLAFSSAAYLATLFVYRPMYCGEFKNSREHGG